MHVQQEANAAVSAKLAEVGALLGEGKISHSYPHCWRCKKPIIFRATEQWFIAMEANDLRAARRCRHINDVQWIPHWGRERIYSMIENRPDWCISRQRTWGVPITAFYCEKCGESLADGKTMHHVADLFAEGGSDIWFEREAKELLPGRDRLPQVRPRRLQQGEGHPRRLVRLRGLPRRRPRAARQPRRAGRHVPGGERPAPRLVPLEPAGRRRHPRHRPLQGGAHPRLRRRRRRQEDVQVPGQRHRPRGGDQEVRRRDPAPVGRRPGLPRRHPHQRGDPAAALRRLPAHPQHRPLHPRQPARLRPGHRRVRRRRAAGDRPLGPLAPGGAGRPGGAGLQRVRVPRPLPRGAQLLQRRHERLLPRRAQGPALHGAEKEPGAAQRPDAPCTAFSTP